MKQLLVIVLLMASLPSFSETICSVTLLEFSDSETSKMVATKVFDVKIAEGGAFGTFYKETDTSKLEISGVINHKRNAEFDIRRVIENDWANSEEIARVSIDGTNKSKLTRIDESSYSLMTSCSSL